jgi:hypothetical protein
MTVPSRLNQRRPVANRSGSPATGDRSDIGTQGICASHLRYLANRIVFRSPSQPVTSAVERRSRREGTVAARGVKLDARLRLLNANVIKWRPRASNDVVSNVICHGWQRPRNVRIY